MGPSGGVYAFRHGEGPGQPAGLNSGLNSGFAHPPVSQYRRSRKQDTGNQHPAHVLAADAFECEQLCAEVFDQWNDVPVEFDDLAVEVENSSSSSPSSFTKLVL